MHLTHLMHLTRLTHVTLSLCQMGADFLRRCKAGVFQYVVVRFLLAVLTLFLRIIGCYEEGNYAYTSAYLWITAICCCSQSWALYSLFMFYHCSHKELITMRPFMKFLCLKMVIFFCWWQALAIGILVRLGRCITSLYVMCVMSLCVMYDVCDVPILPAKLISDATVFDFQLISIANSRYEFS